jgi:hypothetical protein
MILMRANPLQRPLEGVGPENRAFLGPENRDFLGPEDRDFLGPEMATSEA